MVPFTMNMRLCDCSSNLRYFCSLCFNPFFCFSRSEMSIIMFNIAVFSLYSIVVRLNSTGTYELSWVFICTSYLSVVVLPLILSFALVCMVSL